MLKFFPIAKLTRICALVSVVAVSAAIAVVGARAGSAPGDWNVVGHSLSGTRYTQAEQITPANVKDLKVAWVYRTGEDPLHEPDPLNLPSFETSPIKDGNALYFCTPRSQVIAIDAQTGKELWRYDPHTDVSNIQVITCRGVSLYTAKMPLDQCQKRILAGTMDGQLFAVDAQTGKACKDFGKDGVIDLKENLGEIIQGIYGISSPPMVVNDAVIVGGSIHDNQAVDVPSGVVRAFDPVTGKQLWAWDTGREEVNPQLAPGETYTRGSPNAWSLYSADEALGLVYLPTGGGGTDYFGGLRTPVEEKNASAVVALEIATGKVRWRFQTTHHDLWDYDVASQPVLDDIDTPNGKVPALIQTTKRGEVFILDRRDGTPVSRVEERPAPGGAAAGDFTSPTQPYSVDMPSFAGKRLTESEMWGVTPFDMMWCRVQFLKYRYDGLFTPPSEEGSIHSPNMFGASNWGSVSIDEERQIMTMNTTHVVAIAKLIPRAKADAMVAQGVHLWIPMTGTPYAARQIQFLSPFGIPCNAPPWGQLTAVDLKTKKILWQKTLGTTAEKAPLGIGLPLGMPNIGGSIITKSGLVFIGAAVEKAVRAFNIETGEEIWKATLPASAQSTPMTYISEKDGRQYLIVVAGGHAALGAPLGDYVIAYALPDTKKAAGGAGTKNTDSEF